MAAEVWVVFRANSYEDRDLLVVYDHQPTREDLMPILALSGDDEDYAAEKFTINQIHDCRTESVLFYWVSKSGELFRYGTHGEPNVVYLEDSYHDQ